MNTKVLVVVLAAGVLAGALPVSAHHSFSAEFDAKQPVTLTGTVTKVEWANPHAWLYIDVKDDSGKVSNWGLELGGPNALMRLGWSRNSLKPGDVITAEGTRAKDGSNVANARSILLNGKKMFAGSSQGATP
ncbi:MAG TPA: DUF6152 family protein [Terriglobia bacterium]|nr:DUF6152 family protein [Terriglobia bacterium]